MLAGTVARAAAQWVLVWMFAVGDGAAAVGAYSYALAVATPVFLLLTLGLRQVWVAGHSPVPFATFFLGRVATSVVAAAIVLGLCALPGGPVPALALPVVAFKALDAVLDLRFARLQRDRPPAALGSAMSFSAVATAGAAAGVYGLSGEVVPAVWAAVLGPALTLAVFRGPPARRRRGRPRSGHVRRLLAVGLPAGLADALTALAGYVPVLALGLARGDAAVGVFSTALYGVTLANLAMSAAQTVLLGPLAVVAVGQGPREVVRRSRRVTGRLLLPSVLAAAALLALGRDILGWLYGPEFRMHPSELWPLAATIALTPLLTLSGTVLMALNRFGANMWAAAFAVAGSTALACAFATLGRLGMTEAGVVLLTGTVCRIVTAGALIGRLSREGERCRRTG
ncbi:hypothetical protein [Georgenia thermotolerans]|uniref:Oligosaccharide flippase family protein n=1 Tax=Georgenia thermotolerans TaxID=527326 RepID=A0A7J5UQA9_9MICO|nr:hypothetical protein [Georgenia thermotolerans]KAE8764400.1 hypothetical protein GB883_09280 [Georgenia thermotolerans]